MNVTFPKLKWPIAKDDFDALQRWIDQLRDVFEGRISYGRNLASVVVDIDFAAGSTPTKRTAIGVRPLGVVLLSLQQIEPGSNVPPVISNAFSWAYSGGVITLPSLSSIAGTAKHRARILVIKE